MKTALSLAAIAAILSYGVLGNINLLFSGTVEHVIDGDTLQVNGVRTRLWGIDAPERNTIEGLAAKRKLSAFVLNQHVECYSRGEDRYRREIALCYLNGTDLAAYMVATGHAKDWPKYSKGTYAKYEKEGQDAKRR